MKASATVKAYMPVAKRQVFKDAPAYYEVPGRYGMGWDEIGTGLVKDAPMPDEYMPLLSNKDLPRLIDHILPTLNPERKMILRERIQARVQNSRNIYRSKQQQEREALEFRARRLTSNEKAGLKRLKELLRKRSD